jgi:hypothetical protein
VVKKLDAAKAQADQGGEWVFKGETTVDLRPGVNRLSAVATSDGGRGEDAVPVSFTAPAVLVRLKALVVPGAADRPIEPGVAAPVGLVRVRGEVVFGRPDDPALNDPNVEAVLSVNGVRQVPVPLLARAGQAAVRPFDALLGLNRKDNVVGVELYDRTRRDLLRQQQLSGRTFQVSCAAPLTDVRLHVLIVGVNVAGGAELRARVLEALGAVKGSLKGPHGEFEHPAFKKSILYPALVGKVSRSEFDLQMEKVKERITALKGDTGWVNDVVLVYYQGEDWVDPRGQRWLLTSRNLLLRDAPAEAFAIPLREQQPLPGVNLMVLNVRQEPAQTAARPGPDWGGDLSAGLLRFAWTNAALLGSDPELLKLVHEALKDESRLGAVAERLKTLVQGRPDALPPLTDIPPPVTDLRLAGR